MTQQTLEQRVANLERQVAELQQERTNGKPVGQPGSADWKSTIGMFDGDPVMKEIIDETLKIREEDREW